MRKAKAGGAVLLLAIALAACGKRGNPLPPLLRIPAAVETPTAMRVGDEVFVQFTVPRANADGHTPADIMRVEVYAVTGDRAPAATDDPDDLRDLSLLIGSEQVRRPPPPMPPLKPGEPEPPPMPLAPGVDQGAVLVFKETLTPASRTVVTLPPVGGVRPRPPETAVEPLPGPLVAPIESGDPIRYYYAVGVSRSGRYGPVAAFTPVPLGSTSGAPTAPELSYDATTLTIRWKPPADARGVVPPPVEGALPSTPIVPPPPVTTYDVYEVPRPSTSSGRPEPVEGRDPPGNQSPAMPTALTPAPLGPLEHSVPVGSFGTERCFFVRSVDIVDGLHVRGPASPVWCITPKDTFPPEAPKSLAAVAGAGAVNLIWEPNEEADLAGYLVLRGEAAGATLTPLTASPIGRPTYEDRTVKPGMTYSYAIVAVDKAGNRSGESNRVEETAR